MSYGIRTVRPPEAYIMSFEGDDGQLGEGAGEGQAVKLRVVGKPPSQRELDEHSVTHIPYRNWCRHCVSGRGQSDHHRKQLDRHEQEVPVVSIDYAFLAESSTKSSQEHLQPVIVLKDRKSGTVKAHMVEEKGVNVFAVKRLVQDVALLGYKRIVFKSDNEPAILALKHAVKNECPIEIVMEESPVGESASNGEVENAFKCVEGQFRTMKSHLEEEYGEKLVSTHMCVPWMIRHAAELIDRFAVDSDGRTGYQRRKGKRFGGQMMQFGEGVMYLAAKSAGKARLTAGGRKAYG